MELLICHDSSYKYISLLSKKWFLKVTLYFTYIMNFIINRIHFMNIYIHPLINDLLPSWRHILIAECIRCCQTTEQLCVEIAFAL